MAADFTIQGAGHVLLRAGAVAGGGGPVLVVAVDGEVVLRVGRASQLTVNGTPFNTAPVGLGLGALHSAGRRAGRAATVSGAAIDGVLALPLAAALHAIDVPDAAEVRVATWARDAALVVTIDGRRALVVTTAEKVIVNGTDAVQDTGRDAAAPGAWPDLQAISQQLDQVAQLVQDLAGWVDALGPIRTQLGDAVAALQNVVTTAPDTEPRRRALRELARLLDVIDHQFPPEARGGSRGVDWFASRRDAQRR